MSAQLSWSCTGIRKRGNEVVIHSLQGEGEARSELMVREWSGGKASNLTTSNKNLLHVHFEHRRVENQEAEKD